MAHSSVLSPFLLYTHFFSRAILSPGSKHHLYDHESQIYIPSPVETWISTCLFGVSTWMSDISNAACPKLHFWSLPPHQAYSTYGPSGYSGQASWSYPDASLSHIARRISQGLLLTLPSKYIQNLNDFSLPLLLRPELETPISSPLDYYYSKNLASNRVLCSHSNRSDPLKK